MLPYWGRQWRPSVELEIEDDAINTIESAHQERGGEPPRPHVPETRLGVLYGARLSAVEPTLSSAGYTRSSSGRARTYSMAYDEVDPRTRARSADLAYCDDPERPVAAAIRRALSG